MFDIGTFDNLTFDQHRPIQVLFAVNGAYVVTGQSAEYIELDPPSLRDPLFRRSTSVTPARYWRGRSTS